MEWYPHIDSEDGPAPDFQFEFPLKGNSWDRTLEYIRSRPETLDCPIEERE
jgi:hypothetical protein